MFEQDRFIVRLQQSVMREGDVGICFLGGSYGSRRADEFSDLDAVLVYDGDAARDAAWTRRREFAHSVLPYVPARSFDAAHERAYLHSALYSNGAKVDYRYETRESLAPEPAHAEIRILKDADGWAEQYQAASARVLPAVTRVEAAELERLDHQFWVMFWDVYRQLLRGDAERPFITYLNLLDFTLPPLLEALPPEDASYQGLIDVAYSRDAEATLVHLRRLLDAYLAARSAVIRRHNVGYIPDQGFERGIMQTLNRRGR